MAEKQDKWLEVKTLMAHQPVVLDRYTLDCLGRGPQRALHLMAYYKFAAKLVGTGKQVLDVGCGEGLGTWLLAVECGYARGINPDRQTIQTARENWRDSRVSFGTDEFLEAEVGIWDAVVHFDFAEQTSLCGIQDFWLKLMSCLAHDGIAIIGTSNPTTDQNASGISYLGHNNLYSCDRLMKAMTHHFTHVFMFGAIEEVVHSCFLPVSHYLIAVGCRKRG